MLSIKGSKQDKPAASMYFLDSGDDNCLKVKGWGCIEPSQVEVCSLLTLTIIIVVQKHRTIDEEQIWTLTCYSFCAHSNRRVHERRSFAIQR